MILQGRVAAFRGVVRGGVVVLDKESCLKEGTEVVVTPVAGAPGSATAILAAMENSPKVPAQWVDELEQLISEGHRVPAPPELFLDKPGSQESR